MHTSSNRATKVVKEFRVIEDRPNLKTQVVLFVNDINSGFNYGTWEWSRYGKGGALQNAKLIQQILNSR